MTATIYPLPFWRRHFRDAVGMALSDGPQHTRETGLLFLRRLHPELRRALRAARADAAAIQAGAEAGSGDGGAAQC